jgi:predicted GNAT family acetyltransferase
VEEGGRVRVTQFARAEEFLAATEDFRARHATMTNVIGSVATAVAAGRVYSDEFWYAVLDGAGDVVGCAIRTPPWLLAVSPMTAAAAAELSATLARTDPQLPGVVGPFDVAQEIAASLGRSGHVVMSELVRVLGDYHRPSPIAGAARPATPADLEVVHAWWMQFAADAGLPMHDVESLTPQLLDMFSSERLLLWEVDATPVSMAGHASLVRTPGGTVGRIGPVYTPAALRGAGYGTAVTAAMVDRMLPKCDVVMLYTDESNPTSNGIYERLGFEVAGDVVEFEFESSDHAAS